MVYPYERAYKYPNGTGELLVVVDENGDITIPEPQFHVIALSAGLVESY